MNLNASTPSRATSPNTPRRRRIAAVMGLEAATLGIMSTLHLSEALAGGTDAGVAEGLICIVLFAAAAALARNAAQARRLAIAAVMFAILGFIVGLASTIQQGEAIDIAYHVSVLPLLVATLLVLIGRPRQRAAAGHVRR